MSRRQSLLILIPVALFAAWVIAARISWSGAIEGRVLDADSGEPVANAVVAASWRLVGSINAAPLDYIEVLESSAGADGTFKVPSWGPRVRWRGSLWPNDPTLWIVRAGYEPQVLRGAATRDIRLRTLAVDAADPALRVFASDLSIAFFIAPFECEWQRIPHLLRELEATARTAGIPQENGLPPPIADPTSRQCKKSN